MKSASYKCACVYKENGSGGNVCAHMFARHALTIDDYEAWLEEALTWAMSFLFADGISFLRVQ